MRLFLAIPLSASVMDELSAVTASFRGKSGSLRWSAPESWHITLQFLGNTSREQYDCVVTHLRELRSAAVSTGLESIDIFDNAGILFAGVRPTPELLQLQRHIVAATGPCGFVPETRPFHPHITLARSKGKAQSHELHQLKSLIQRRPPRFSRFVAEEFLLYESFTGPSGSRYEVRECFPLRRMDTGSQL
jgi:RNA 2',3'-cyclic 3'-phosphodiesterase